MPEALACVMSEHRFAVLMLIAFIAGFWICSLITIALLFKRKIVVVKKPPSTTVSRSWLPEDLE